MLVSFWSGSNWQKQSGTRDNFDQVVVDRTLPDGRKVINLDLFWKVWDKLGEAYLIKEDLMPQQMVWGAIKGMTASLGDPYTVFLPPKDNKASKEDLNGAFEGVGIQLGFKDSYLAVVAPLSGMPAEKEGIRAGDFILHLKDEGKGIDVDTRDMSLPEAVEIIRGKKGDPITLTILREGETDSFEVTIKRDTIVIPSVELKWEDNDQVAWLKLSRFGGRTEEEWLEAVEQINAKRGVLGVVLDLRNNPGGYLDGAVRYASEFLPVGQVVVQQQDAAGNKETYSVTIKGQLTKIPLVVLINEGSASSSEILAGALRDHQRAKLIGEKSFGKGTVQEALDLGAGAGLHVTTAKWLLPMGEWVNETKGIIPTVEVADDKETVDVDEQLLKAIEVLKEAK